MNDKTCLIPEEKWIDWHRGSLGEEEATALLVHQQQCGQCREVYEQWGRWLGVPSDEGAGILPGGAPSARSRRRTSAMRLIVRSRRWRIGSPLLQGAAAVFAILLLAGGLWSYARAGNDEATLLPERPLDPAAYAERHIPEGAALMSRQDTVVYTLSKPRAAVSALDGDTELIVWMNDRTQELLILLQGVLPAADSDVQAWGTASERLTSFGLLEFHERQGHLYAKLRDLQALQEVLLTLEPKGGSLAPSASSEAGLQLGIVR